MKQKIVLILALLVWGMSVFAQRSQEEQLGIQYYQNGEFEKAVQMFDKAYNASSGSYIYYYYYQSLLQIGDFSEAEKLVKKQQKKYPQTQRYKIDLGFVYESAGDNAKATKVYVDALKDVPAQKNVVKELYNAFSIRKQYDYCIATLEKGRKLLNDPLEFIDEMTGVYQLMNRPDKVLEESLKLVENKSQGEIPRIQKIIQNLLTEDENGQRLMIVQTGLQRKVQEEQDNPCYAVLLQWVYQLKKDYESALPLAKSLDRKLKEDGGRVYHFAEEAANNRAYSVAVDALNYLLNKGESGSYYTDSQFLLLDIKYRELISVTPVNKEEALALEGEFKRVLQEYGIHESTSEWVRKYAHLLAFYVDKSDEAVELLENAIANTSRDPQVKGQFKVDLADIQLYKGDVWEATLLYSQVEKDLPNDLIGQNAKYKNAKLSFYIGEFEWAKSQLDVLRAATSKLIANDAMYFSLLITDNEEENEDEEVADDDDFGGLFASTANTNQPLRYYAKADFLIFQNKDEEALQMLDSVLQVAPAGKLADDVYFQKAKILIKKKDYLGAEQLLQKILTAYPYELLADDATYQLAELYEYYLKDISRAMEYYQKLLKNYPDSLYTVDARKHYRELRGDSAK
ncbi:MAG: tetratricopeptide repeat protein [Bacteroidales bacterium]|nr:tetratricopeptide repeat protein [Bacteroidales bacterium]